MEVNEMKNEESQLDANQGGEQQDAATATEISNRDEQAPTAEEILSWEKDKRFNTFWKKDPNKMYKDLIEKDKMYTQGQQTLAQLKKEMEAKSGEFEPIKQKATAYDQFENYLKMIEAHPELKNKLYGVFEEVNKQLKRIQYGVDNDLPDHILQKLDKVSEFESKLQQIEQEKAINENVKIIDSEVKKIDQFASEYGIEYDKKDFLDFCHKNNIPFNMMMDKFIAISLPEIKKTLASQTQKTVLNNQNSNRAAQTLGGTKTPAQSNPKLSYEEAMMQVLTKT